LHQPTPKNHRLLFEPSALSQIKTGVSSQKKIPRAGPEGPASLVVVGFGLVVSSLFGVADNRERLGVVTALEIKRLLAAVDVKNLPWARRFPRASRRFSSNYALGAGETIDPN
jgi:hypothetical protein